MSHFGPHRSGRSRDGAEVSRRGRFSGTDGDELACPLGRLGSTERRDQLLHRRVSERFSPSWHLVSRHEAARQDHRDNSGDAKLMRGGHDFPIRPRTRDWLARMHMARDGQRPTGRIRRRCVVTRPAPKGRRLRHGKSARPAPGRGGDMGHPYRGVSLSVPATATATAIGLGDRQLIVSFCPLCPRRGHYPHDADTIVIPCCDHPSIKEGLCRAAKRPVFCAFLAPG